ncbi:MAG TPA: hypothetical protein ENH82_00780 [bacterium]|nr:hypothetical protein [bacterium]
MFNQKLIEKIKELEFRISKLENPIIGECRKTEILYPGAGRLYWEEFRKTAITDELDGKIKIWNDWREKSDCIFYDEYWKNQKALVEEKERVKK